MRDKINVWNVIGKAALLFVAFNLLLMAVAPNGGNTVSVYNWLVPGRERLPFGENQTQSYNLSLFDVDAMFAAHEIAGAEKAPDEFRVILVGDSSVWGILLHPDETLAAQLNALGLTLPDGRKVRVYNLGYPTISLTKDLLILDKAMQYEPDLVIWMMTLEAFPADKQLTPPLVAHNRARVLRLDSVYGLDIDPNDPALIVPSRWDATLIGRRRAWADWARLQVYGIMWGITGVDQYYPEEYAPAQVDFAADDTFHAWHPAEMTAADLAFPALRAGAQIVGETPLVIVNEPILISDGENSDIRYNYFYPRWAYDRYRIWMNEQHVGRSWQYVDLWDLIPMNEFTNSGVHLTPSGEKMLAERVKDVILAQGDRYMGSRYNSGSTQVP